MDSLIDFFFSNDAIAFFCVFAFVIFPWIVFWLMEADGMPLLKQIIKSIVVPLVSIYLISIGVWSADGWLERIFDFSEAVDAHTGRGGALGLILVTLWPIITIGWGLILFILSRKI